MADYSINEKELALLQKLDEKLTKLKSMIGPLDELPTSDKTSIVNSIKQITLGTYEDPKIDSEKIIQEFENNLT